MFKACILVFFFFSYIELFYFLKLLRTDIPISFLFPSPPPQKKKRKKPSFLFYITNHKWEKKYDYNMMGLPSYVVGFNQTKTKKNLLGRENYPDSNTP